MTDKLLKGTMLRFSHVGYVMNMAKNAGLDFVMMDAEHGDYGMETLRELFYCARMTGIQAYVRVPELARGYVSRVLDMGANGVMVPMLETREMAEKFVSFAKYPPTGNRGLTTNSGHTNFLPDADAVGLMARCNACTYTIAQIETKTAVDNACDIAAVDGIDVLLVGPNDLSVSLGIPGDIMNRTELEAIGYVREACRKYGKKFGLHSPIKMIEYFAPEGVDIMMTQTDDDIILNGMTELSKSLDKFIK